MEYKAKAGYKPGELLFLSKLLVHICVAGHIQHSHPPLQPLDTMQKRKYPSTVSTGTQCALQLLQAQSQEYKISLDQLTSV